ncbi:MAG: stage II sporulation protein P [Butyrivibrio sp.]|nr:stage II sporulation protein P [Butyrivibrio sp.]
MNKYQWMKRNRNSNNFYKMIVLLILFVTVSFVFMRGCQSIAKDIWHKAADKTADKLGKLSFDALVSHEIYDDFDGGEGSLMAELVMNQIFPVGELYMQSYVEPIGDGSEPDYYIAERESQTGEPNGDETEPSEAQTSDAEETEAASEAPVHETESSSNGQTSTPSQSETASSDPTANVYDSEIMAAAASIYPADKLLDYDYVLNNFFVVPSVTTLRRSVLDLKKIAATDVTLEKDPEVPQILIFHTHSQEGFADYETNPKSIVDVGNYLTELLQGEYGYNVIHLTDEFDMLDGKLDRGKAYTYANEKIERVLAENPSIQVVIDLHRDGVRDDLHLVTDINGRQTAKIMLFNGISYTNEVGEIDYLENPYLTENLTMTYKMYLLGKASYPDFIRCIYVSGYRYCLYHRARSMLIEAGAQTNTYEEVRNAMEPLAELINKELTVN